jgi:hypothetical protein
MLIPLVGIALLPRTPLAGRRPRWDVVVAGLVLLLLAQSVSVWTTVGRSEELHVFTGAALLALGLAARTPTVGMTVADVRRAASGLVAPLSVFFTAGWVAQYFHLVPSLYTSAMHLLAIRGYRLEGLTSHPNSLGLIAALAFVIAVAAESSVSVWFGRVVALATIVGSDSRTSVVVAGVGLVMIWILGPAKRFSRRVVNVGVVGAAALLAWGEINIQRSSSADVLTNRDVLWHKLLPYLQGLPLFGYGPEFLQEIRVQLFGPYVSPTYYVDAQNQWLSDAIQFGIPAAVLTTLLFVAIATRGPLAPRRVLLIPLVAVMFVECFSEVPISLWSSTEAAFPLFLVLTAAPLAHERGASHDEAPAPRHRAGTDPQWRCRNVTS